MVGGAPGGIAFRILIILIGNSIIIVLEGLIVTIQVVQAPVLRVLLQVFQRDGRGVLTVHSCVRREVEGEEAEPCCPWDCCCSAAAPVLFAQSAAAAAPPCRARRSSTSRAALAVGLAALGGGIAVGQIGAAAHGRDERKPRPRGPGPAVRRAGGRNLPLGIHRRPDDPLRLRPRHVAFHFIGSEELAIGFRFVGVPATVVGTAEEAREAFRAITRQRRGRRCSSSARRCPP